MAVTLGYAIFFAGDLERSISFYRDILGVPLRFSTDSYAEFQTDGAKFALYSRAHLPELIGREAPPGPVPWPQGEIAFLVEDPDAEHERLRRSGVTILAPPTDRPWGERTVHLSDPDGNIVELTRPKRPSLACDRARRPPEPGPSSSGDSPEQLGIAAKTTLA